MIEENGFIRFLINLKASRQTGLRITTPLLVRAKRVDQ